MALSDFTTAERELGVDVAAPNGDMDANSSETAGNDLLVQDLTNRIISRPDNLWYTDEEHGFGLVNWIGREFSKTDKAELWRIASGIEAECRQDPRVEDVTVTVEPEAFRDESAATKLKVTVGGESAVGPFELVLTIGDVSVEILNRGSTET